MPSMNPVARIADTALKVAGRAVGLVVGGVRGAARLANPKPDSAGSRADSADRAATDTAVRSETGAAPQGHEAAPPGPVTAPPAEPDASIEEIAEAAVARELAEEPQPTEVAPEPTPAPPSGAESETVYSTSTEDAD